MKKTYTRRLDRFINLYRTEQQISFALAEQRLMREFQRRVALRATSRPQAAVQPQEALGEAMAVSMGV